MVSTTCSIPIEISKVEIRLSQFLLNSELSGDASERINVTLKEFFIYSHLKINIWTFCTALNFGVIGIIPAGWILSVSLWAYF
jgi:hypothetical protein